MLKYGLPYGVSTLAAVFAALAEKHWQTCELTTVLLCWTAENGGYYFTAILCDRFLPQADRIFQGSSESLKQLLLVEGIDTALRFLLLWACPLILGNRELGTALGSIFADIGFAVTLNKSHRLVEICRKVSGTAMGRITALKGSLVATPSADFFRPTGLQPAFAV